MKPSALFDPVGRRRVAQVIVRGSRADRFFTRLEIEFRIEKVLERIARKVEGDEPHRTNLGNSDLRQADHPTVNLADRC